MSMIANVGIYLASLLHIVCSPTPRGFEPLRAEPNGFLVHLLNHSDTVSMQVEGNECELLYCNTIPALEFAILCELPTALLWRLNIQSTRSCLDVRLMHSYCHECKCNCCLIVRAAWEVPVG